MRLFHVTTTEGLRGIRRDRYIDPMKASSRNKVSWFVQADRVEWAIGHVQIRHGVSLNQVRVIELDLGDAAVMRFADSLKFTRSERTPYPGGEYVTRAAVWYLEGGDDVQWGVDMDAEYNRLHPQ